MQAKSDSRGEVCQYDATGRGGDMGEGRVFTEALGRGERRRGFRPRWECSLGILETGVN